MTRIAREDITGLVLAGGEGRRMGGLDKGLQPFRGQPLAAHALARLAPQVGTVLISANRHAAEYAALGAALVPDTPAESSGTKTGPYRGPLAGMLAGVLACRTPWLLCVPCDCPAFPLDLATRLVEGLSAHGGKLAIACTPPGGNDPAPRRHPVFCLLSTTLGTSIQAWLDSGQGRVDAWGAQHRRAQVLFDDGCAFRNLNTLAELRACELSAAGH